MFISAICRQSAVCKCQTPVFWPVSVKRRLQTADCRPGGKMQTEGKINTNNKKRVIRINKECLKDNPVLHLSTTRIIMTAGRCTFWGLLLRVHGKCDR